MNLILSCFPYLESLGNDFIHLFESNPSRVVEDPLLTHVNAKIKNAKTKKSKVQPGHFDYLDLKIKSLKKELELQLQKENLPISSSLDDMDRLTERLKKLCEQDQDTQPLLKIEAAFENVFVKEAKEEVSCAPLDEQPALPLSEEEELERRLLLLDKNQDYVNSDLTLKNESGNSEFDELFARFRKLKRSEALFVNREAIKNILKN
jgi:hypothetical protein